MTSWGNAGVYVGATKGLPVPTRQPNRLGTTPEGYGRNRFVSGSVIKLTDPPADPDPAPRDTPPSRRDRRRASSSRSSTTRTATTRSRVDASDLVRRYQEGQTVPAIAAETGHARDTVRRHLRAAGVQMRDDRSRSGGRNARVDPPELVAELRRLYVDERLSITETAQALSLSPRVVQRALRRNNIPTRTPGPLHKPGRNYADALAQQLTTAGATAADVRTWARANGVPVPARGLVPTTVVAAYLAAEGATR